jgi:glycosyltransferase involved in cell wall biosynthesis
VFNHEFESDGQIRKEMTTNNNRPRVSIGLPVFNGENYLAEALDSLLGQTFPDFELIISDNASTDRTEEICRSYAAKDRRIRYYRNDKNVGATRNFYRVFDLAMEEYFKWAAHDDVHGQEFVERCLEVLDRDSTIVLCYPKTKLINEHGRFLRDDNLEVDTTSSKPHERLYNMLSVDHWCFQIFGLMRADVLSKTQRYHGFYGWDRALLAELCLLGRVYEFPERLFFRREHPLTSVSLFLGKQKQVKLFDPNINWQTQFLGLERFYNYFTAVTHAPLSQSERLLCYGELVRLVAEKSVNRVRRRWSQRVDPSPTI